MDGFGGWNEMKVNGGGGVLEKGDGIRFWTDVTDEPEMETNVRLFHRWMRTPLFLPFVFNPDQLFGALLVPPLPRRNCSIQHD